MLNRCPCTWIMICATLALTVVGCGRYGVAADPDGAPPDQAPAPDAALPPDARTVMLDTAPPDLAIPDLEIDTGLLKSLKITNTSPLPAATEGVAYKVQFAATGGTAPLGWLVKKGGVPHGLILQSGGLLTGTPTKVGDFPFTIKAVDDSTPPRLDQKAFTLTVKVAPLRITGGQVYNLLVVKVVVLPMITIIKGVKIPYSTQLQAKGGLKPYTWTEQKLPSLLASLVPKNGIPKGLTLDTSGKLHGSVSDTKDVVSVTIPGTSLPLKGFLFAARVTDNQKTKAKADGVFLLPAIP